jgi:hypothetical protein
MEEGTRLHMGQYGLWENCCMAHWTKGPLLTYGEQNAIHVLRWPRASKELDRGL